MAKEEKISVEEFTFVKDIKENFIYTRDNFLICHIRVQKIIIDLLKTEEKKAKSDNLASAYEGDKNDFVYVSYPREIDLDKHKQDIKDLYEKEKNMGRRELPEIELGEYNHLSTSGQNYEHQHYIKVWKYIGNREPREVKVEFMQRVRSIVQRYDALGAKPKILNTGETIKLCNLYGNPGQAPFDVPVNDTYEGMTFINE